MADVTADDVDEGEASTAQAESIDSADIAVAKRKMRDEHIGDNGRSQYDHIFVPVVKEYFDIETFERQPDVEGGSVEHAWETDTGIGIAMVHDSWDGQYKIKEETPTGAGDVGSFPFEAKKHAEARLVERMLYHEEDVDFREMVEETAKDADLEEMYEEER